METQKSNYTDLLDIVIQHYYEFLINSGEELVDKELLDKAANIIRGVAENAYAKHLIDLPFPQVKVLPDSTLNVVYYPVSGVTDEFFLFEVDYSDKIKFMAKDSGGCIMSGVMPYKNIRLAPFLFFNA